MRRRALPWPRLARELVHYRLGVRKQRCRTPGGVEVLVAVPYRVSLPDKLAESLCLNLRAMECANPGMNLHLGLTSKVPESDDSGGRGRIAARVFSPVTRFSDSRQFGFAQASRFGRVHQ